MCTAVIAEATAETGHRGTLLCNALIDQPVESLWLVKVICDTQLHKEVWDRNNSQDVGEDCDK